MLTCAWSLLVDRDVTAEKLVDDLLANDARQAVLQKPLEKGGRHRIVLVGQSIARGEFVVSR